MNEYGTAWNASRDRVSDLILRTELSKLDAIAPLTPEWRVRDIVAHLVGVAQDVSSGNFPQDFDAWTRAQVERLRTFDAHELIDQWQEFPIGEMLSESLAIALYDQVTHEADICHALGVPIALEPRTLSLLSKFTLSRFAAQENDLCVTLHLDDQDFVSGDGARALTLSATAFDWFRASNGRRSVTQIKAMEWWGDVDVIAILFASGFFTPAHDDVFEIFR
ncbi:MAG: hypothetical protein F2790_01065 [Actinobacteria bacterium]|nr:hypothetical protein [Actinomycetota bacterium]